MGPRLSAASAGSNELTASGADNQHVLLAKMMFDDFFALQKSRLHANLTAGRPRLELLCDQYLLTVEYERSARQRAWRDFVRTARPADFAATMDMEVLRFERLRLNVPRLQAALQPHALDLSDELAAKLWRVYEQRCDGAALLDETNRDERRQRARTGEALLRLFETTTTTAVADAAEDDVDEDDDEDDDVETSEVQTDHAEAVFSSASIETLRPLAAGPTTSTGTLAAPAPSSRLQCRPLSVQRRSLQASGSTATNRCPCPPRAVRKARTLRTRALKTYTEFYDLQCRLGSNERVLDYLAQQMVDGLRV